MISLRPLHLKTNRKERKGMCRGRKENIKNKFCEYLGILVLWLLDLY